jgi:hypothetical protein
LPGARSLAAFLVAWLGGIAAAVALVVVLAPVVTPPCPDPTAPCPGLVARAGDAVGPASQQEGTPVMRFGQTHAAEGAAWQLDFDPRWWLADASDPSGALWLTTGYSATTVRGNMVQIPLTLRLEVVPLASATAEQMLEHLASLAAETLESTTEVGEHGTRLLRPHIGFQDATARYLVGDFGTAGSLTPFGAHLLAASDGRQTAGMILYVGQPDESFPFFSGSVRTTRFVGDMLDDILKRFYWTEAGP